MTVESFALVRSRRFLWDMPDHAIDRWHPGSDLAGWMYAHLLRQPELDHHREPVMEDWGWTMSVEAADGVATLDVWHYPDLDGVWAVRVGAAPGGWFRRPRTSATTLAHDTLNAALASVLLAATPDVEHVWLDVSPWEEPLTAWPTS